MQITSSEHKFNITGRVVDRTTQKALSDLRVEAWDHDHICNDLIGTATTDQQGAFQMSFNEAYFEELFLDRHPDLFFKVFAKDRLLKSTEDSILWNVEAGETTLTIEVDAPIQNRYVIEGQLNCLDTIDFQANQMAVHAYVDDVEVAQAIVDSQGKYRLAFDFHKRPTTTELRVVPAQLSAQSDRIPSLRKRISASRYRVKDHAYYTQYDLLIPRDYLRLLVVVTKTYHMHGTVYATTFAGDLPISVDPLPAAKLEFYEVDAPIFYVIGTTPPLTEGYLGYAYSRPDGSYDFEFDFSYTPWILYWWWLDRVPDIRVRISQFDDGIWQEVYEGPVDWNIAEDFHRDYFIPIENAIPIPDGGAKPSEGFRFVSLGLLPIDATRIVDGYASAQPGDPDPIEQVSHQPLCGKLRIFGLFAESPPVASYMVEIAHVANANVDLSRASISWKPVTDALHNRRWNSALRRWDFHVLGPDPNTGRYQNIDTQPEADWHEHSLKVTWRSTNEPDGYYALRITGYDAAGNPVGDAHYMPIMRIDNSKPEANLEAIGTKVCGEIQLGSDRDIKFNITAHDPEGHVLYYSLKGTRGKDAITAGSDIKRPDKDDNDTWTGTKFGGTIESFKVDPLPSSLSHCSMVAYNFELYVQGLSTNGYAVDPVSQRVKCEANLIVSE